MGATSQLSTLSPHPVSPRNLPPPWKHSDRPWLFNWTFKPFFHFKRSVKFCLFLKLFPPLEFHTCLSAFQVSLMASLNPVCLQSTLKSTFPWCGLWLLEPSSGHAGYMDCENGCSLVCNRRKFQFQMLTTQNHFLKLFLGKSIFFQPGQLSFFRYYVFVWVCLVGWLVLFWGRLWK